MVLRTTPACAIWCWEVRSSRGRLRRRFRAICRLRISPIFTVRPKLRSMPLDLLSKVSSPVRASRSVVLCPTTGSMYWTVVWSLYLLVLSGSFTLRVLGLGGGMLGAGVGGGSALLRTALVLRGAGCTAAGTWRAGAGMGFWSLWGERTIRLRFAASALSLGRSRPRWLGTRM